MPIEPTRTRGNLPESKSNAEAMPTSINTFASLLYARSLIALHHHHFHHSLPFCPVPRKRLVLRACQAHSIAVRTVLIACPAVPAWVLRGKRLLAVTAGRAARESLLIGPIFEIGNELLERNPGLVVCGSLDWHSSTSVKMGPVADSGPCAHRYPFLKRRLLPSVIFDITGRSHLLDDASPKA
jgi:hypothetical protein